MTTLSERLRIVPTVTLAQSQTMIPIARQIRQIMVERFEAADALDKAAAENEKLRGALETIAGKHAEDFSTNVPIFGWAEEIARGALMRGKE